jgi:hypothetical protein
MAFRLKPGARPEQALEILQSLANALRNLLPTLPYTDKKGKKSTPIPDKGYTVIECAAAVRPEA